MKKVGQHRHIISLISCCTRGDNVCLIEEFAEHGDLLHFLRDKRKKVKYLINKRLDSIV